MSSRVESRRVIAVALMALAIMGVVLARTATAADVVDTTRVAGTNRYGTACEAAKAAFPGGTSTAIIATGENFPDALAAAGLAGDLSAPVLLVQRDAIPTETASCLQALGVTKVVIVGGQAAVSTAVEQELAQDYAVSRSSGDDRYGTAAAVAEDMNAVCSLTGGTTAIIATGENYPDALAAGPLAYIGDGTDACPILLVHHDSIPQATRDALAALGIDNIIVMGGTSAVSAATMAQLASLTGDATPTRLAGTTREGTAAGAATALRDTFGCNIDTVIIAGGRPRPGQTFAPDPLSASALGGERCAPILLIPSPDDLGDDASGFISANHEGITDIIGVGGTAVVSNGVLSTAEGNAETGTTTTTSSSSTSSTSSTSTTSTTVPGGAALTKRPELKSASFTTQTVVKAPVGSTPGRSIGVYVTYTFDEPVLNTEAALPEAKFHVYAMDNTRYDGSTDAYEGTRPRVLSSGTAVEVYYPGFATATESSVLTVAAVEFGAVKDSDGFEGTEGAASIGSSSTTALTAGKTGAPDVNSVGSFANDPGSTDTFVNLSFDQNAFRTGAGGVQLELSNSELVACSYVVASATDGKTSVKYSCDEPTDPAGIGGYSGVYTSTQVNRAIVLAGTFGSTTGGGGVTNPLETTPPKVNPGSNSPDLASVSGTAGTLGNPDVVLYTFDEALSGAPGSAADFLVYDNDGTEHGGTAVHWSSGNTKAVAIDFPNGTLNKAVGASVVTGAANGAGGNDAQAAELPLTGAPSTVRSPGLTTGPQLTGVEVKSTDVLGTIWVGIYTFDEAIGSVDDDSQFVLYEGDGTRHVANGGTCTIGSVGGASLTEKQVQCTFAPGGSTAAAVHRSVVGAVGWDAVSDAGGAPGGANTEGAKAAVGSNGTPQS